MKKLALSAMMLALVSAYPALAVEEHHPDQKPGAGAAQAAPAKPAADPEKAVQKLKDNTKKLQAQLDKIGKAKDARERQKLLGEHMQTMQESMMVAGAMGSGGMMGGGMMGGGMMGCPMMSGMMGGGQGGMMGMMHGGQGGGMMGGGMMGGGAGGPGADAMMGRMQQMEKRVDMMQMMMEQMLKGQTPPAQK
ncbi:MAG: hypothetical protein HYU77_15590 [Betaproteobacteria bacterium]|nr:hypothetical protein [Betaproteobacteria bacterium]